MERNGISSRLLTMLIIILVCFVASENAIQSDIACLKSIKESLQDPFHVLSSWDFSNITEGFICRFVGIDCWHADENKVINIQLSDMGLIGSFPTGIRNCTSMSGLNLSNNQLTGPIPSNLPDVLPYITSLDLSYNNLSGQIPPSIANCRLINILMLNNNHLTGQIPQDISELPRLKMFSVADNTLSGRVPTFLYSNFTAESYANNPQLCGGPLNACKNEHHDHDHIVLSGFAVGVFVSTIITMLLIFYFLPTLSISNMQPFTLMNKKIMEKKHIPGSPKILFAEEICGEASEVALMQRFVRNISLLELEMATDNFDSKKIIGYGNMGIMYRAAFPNGSLLAVKMFHKFESLQREFLLEIEILGRLPQTNLIRMLGFCYERNKKCLVYEYMSNGSLHHWLHSRPQVEATKMRWTLRFKIAVGIARGIAWLHHNNVLRVAHLKINSKCILLDDKFEPKITNFGNSMILMNTSNSPSSVCNFVVSGTSSYKEDVHSFGILLLELISGEEPSTSINSSRQLVVIDECLMGQGFDEGIYEACRIAEKCIQAHKDGAISMLHVYRAMRAIAISRNKLSVDSCIDVEDNE